MRYDPTRQLLTKCLERVTADDAGHFIDNPAIPFTNDAKAGKYDHLSDDEYNALLCRIEALSDHWNKQPRRTAGDILLAVLERITIPLDRLERIVDLLTEWYDWEKPGNDEEGRTVAEANAEADAVLEAGFAARGPAEIRDAVASRVIGQPEGAKAAAMITYGQLAGRRTIAVFCGPSGCGKSEIWRCLSKEYPGLVRIVDFSRMSGDGWAGSMHLRDVFEGVNPDDIRRHGLIVVLDEADKILCETAIGASGNNHNHIVQNNLLKMLDGDVIEFGNESGRAALSVDCSNISVVMLGAFENLLANKAGSKKRIGFGTAPEADPLSHGNISYDDLIRAGTRREIAGRINRIVAMAPLGAGSYKAILEGPVLSDLEESFGCRIRMDDAAADMLSKQAAASGLGVRWAKSAMRNALEDALFDASAAEEYRVDMQDGKLRCQAQSPRKEAPAELHAAPDDRSAPDDWPDIDDDLPF